jgi:peptidyl-prolyl cis-trans isomerase C
MNTPPELAYLLLRTALERFGVCPQDLDPARYAQVLQQAQRHYYIESLTLNADEVVHISVAQVDEAVANIRTRYADEDSFSADLHNNGISIENFRAALERELRVDAILSKVAAQAATVSPLDAKIYYHMHPQRFAKPETRTARHILVTINPNYPENSRTAAWQRITALAKRVQHKPQRFAEQALKHSECPTAMNGGQLGQVPQGKLYPQLDTVLFTLKAGQISNIIESELGFHLLYCEEIHPAGLLPYHEVAPLIMTQLQQRRQRLCQKYWLKAQAQKQSHKLPNDHLLD